MRCLAYLKIDINERKQNQLFRDAVLNSCYKNIGKIHKEKPIMIFLLVKLRFWFITFTHTQKELMASLFLGILCNLTDHFGATASVLTCYYNLCQFYCIF